MQHPNMLQALQQEVEYVDVHPRPDREPASFYAKWVDQSSAKHATPELIAADALRRLYPGHSLVVSEDNRLAANLPMLPGIKVHPPESKEAELQQLSNLTFQPYPGRIRGEVTGSLVDDVIVGSHRVTWNESDFIVLIAKFHIGNFTKVAHFILHDGPEQPVRDLVLAACIHAERLHDEVWVFNRGFWSKDKALWLEIKAASWDDVIMKEDSKQTLQKDIHGFFKSETTYKKFSIPWKRGLIMYGPPGNGKTISIKVIMKVCAEHGFTPLYVKSFQSPMGEEGAMQSVFSQARQVAPCVLILEDLDSLINDRNRSFFLNQLDGLEGNDGLLVIATTNHFDKLDPGLSSRPSRFDRRYLFDDPDYQTRMLYAKYWQEKLKDNDEIWFPDSLALEVADLTQGFSFAYLKEAFVSALVRITSADVDERMPFPNVLRDQILSLRKELGKQAPSLPRKSLDEGILPVEHTSREKLFGPTKPTLPAGVSSTQTQSDAIQEPPTARVICAYPGPGPARSVPRPNPLPSWRVSGTPPFRQAQVLHAPPSAYPQVMPGSLPSITVESMNTQAPASSGWYHPLRLASGANASTVVDTSVNQNDPLVIDTDKPPMVKIDEKMFAESLKL